MTTSDHSPNEGGMRHEERITTMLSDALTRMIPSASRPSEQEPVRAKRHAGAAVVLSFPAAPPPCADTIECLERLLEEARRGQIVGVAVAAMRKGHKFATVVTGEAYCNPVFARGMVASLDDHVRDTMTE